VDKGTELGYWVQRDSSAAKPYWGLLNKKIGCCFYWFWK